MYRYGTELKLVTTWQTFSFLSQIRYSWVSLRKNIKQVWKKLDSQGDKNFDEQQKPKESLRPKYTAFSRRLKETKL